MPLTLQDIVPQQAGWDAVVQANFQAILTYLQNLQPLPTYTIASGINQLPAASSVVSQ